MIGKSRLLMMAWISSAWVRGRVAREARLIHGQLKQQGYVGVFAYFEGAVSSREANGLLSFFFHEFRRKETDFIVTNSGDDCKKWGPDLRNPYKFSCEATGLAT